MKDSILPKMRDEKSRLHQIKWSLVGFVLMLRSSLSEVTTPMTHLRQYASCTRANLGVSE